MRTVVFGMLVWLSISAHAHGWNEKGHMVVARLAWLKLSPQERQTASDILRSHPHYGEFLSVNRPEGISEDEWTFMRAAVWADWIRNNHTDEFNKPTWHYINVPFVPPYSKLKASDFPAEPFSVVTQIPECLEKLRAGSSAEKPIYLCWVLHLIGDVHQPLHCATLFSEVFPVGDRGGNLAMVRIAGGMPVRLHPIWDGLLGDSLELPSILDTAEDLRRLEQRQADQIKQDLATRTTVRDWVDEGFESSKKDVYLLGDLKPANSDDHPSDESLPELSEGYIVNATQVARIAAVKAGCRLAANISAALR